MIDAVASVEPSSTSTNSIVGAAFWARLVRFSAAYRSTLKRPEDAARELADVIGEALTMRGAARMAEARG